LASQVLQRTNKSLIIDLNELVPIGSAFPRAYLNLAMATFITWLYTGTIDDSEIGQDLPSVTIWLFGEHIGAPEFQNAVMDTMLKEQEVSYHNTFSQPEKSRKKHC